MRSGLVSVPLTVLALFSAVHSAKGAISRGFKADYRFVEFWSGLIALTFGVWNLIDPQQLRNLEQYDLINKVFPEPSIEIIAMLFGLYQMAAAAEGKRPNRAWAAFMCSWFYSFFVYSFLTARMIPVGFVFTIGYVAANVFAITRLVSGAK